MWISRANSGSTGGVWTRNQALAGRGGAGARVEYVKRRVEPARLPSVSATPAPTWST